jgi:UDPglucose--hexose-1-phosphate uridylyltransferase
MTRPSRLERHELVHGDGRRLFVYGELRGDLSDTKVPPDPGGLHKRYDLLTGAWVAVSPSRNRRPNSSDAGDGDGTGDAGDPCSLCPGGPELPFSYDAAVFENRFPSFVGDPPPAMETLTGPAVGRCEVVVYTERHEASLANLTPAELARVIAIWRDRSAELWADRAHQFVMVFENRGSLVGATISHPHGQLYAFDHLPPTTALRASTATRHRAETGRCLGCDVIETDGAASARVISQSDAFLVAVPHAARWPYEVHVRARRHGLRRLSDLDVGEQKSLASALREVVLRYDGLFGFELPYMMVAQEAPEGQDDWHLSFEFLPPHRTPHLLKIPASVETATGLFINDTLPETSAAHLSAVAIGPPVEESEPSLVVVSDLT